MLNVRSVTPTDRANNPILAVCGNQGRRADRRRRASTAQFSNTIWGNGFRSVAAALPNFAMTTSATLR
jgi:hypothetical protein